MAKKTTVKKAAKKVAPRQVAKKATSKKPVKKAAVKKAVAKKPVTKKVAAKKTVKKAAVKKTDAKKAVKKAIKKVTRKTVVKKATTKTVAKQAVKKTVKKVVKKAAAKKTAKKVAVKKVIKKITKKTTVKQVAKKIVVAKKAAVKTIAKKPVATPEPVVNPRRAFGSYNGIILCENPKLFPEKSPYSEKDIAKLKQMLDERCRHLLEVLREIDELMFQNTSEKHKHVPTGYATHLVENAVENTETETALLVRQDEEETLMQVNAAIERMESGLFGVCVACAAKIGMPRLRAKPEAHLCIKCKQRYDKECSRRR